MNESVPFIDKAGERILAAVMFTDVVGFSKRMSSNENETLELLQEDFSTIGQLVEHYKGRVIKTLGDGLLVSFSGAVNAVACGVKIQEAFNNRSRPAAADHFLQHRIGIHLGDIYVTDSEIMGDGVNVAARLQAEAEPGGICISKTVFDVIKGKLEIQAVSLGPKKLKNISESVHLYQILINVIAEEKRKEIQNRTGLDDGTSLVRKRTVEDNFIATQRNSFFWKRILFCFELIALALFIFLDFSKILTLFFFSAPSKSGYHFFEGIFKYPLIRLFLFFSLFIIVYIFTEIIFRKTNIFISESSRIISNIIYFVIVNVLYILCGFLVIFILYILDPIISIW